MRDGRLIIILIVTYNIRCIGAISFTCVHDIRRYIFLDQLFSRATMRDHSGRGSVSFFFFHILLFSSWENRIHHLCLSKYWRDSIHNEKFCLVVIMLKFFLTEHGSVSFARQQRRSIIHQWTMFGTDCNGPQLAASVSLFIQFSLVLHFFLFLPASSEYMYTFFCWTYLLFSLLLNDVLSHNFKFI